MALRTMRKKEGQPAFSPAQITTAATRFYVLGRTLPNRTGLALQQVTEAIRSAGYSPHLLPLPTDQTNLTESIQGKKKILYPYVESGIPVLLLLFPSPNDGHAVVLIGHGWTESPDQFIELTAFKTQYWADNIRTFDAASWVEPFLIHNDNAGPYLDLPADGQGYNLSQAKYAIPLLKPDVFIDGAEAQEATLRLLTDIFSFLKPANGTHPSTTMAPRLVLRTYLEERSRFRASIANGDATGDLADYYRAKWLPRRFWLTELNMFDEYSNAPTGTQMRVGEVLMDAAAEAEDGAFLSIRLAEQILPGSANGIGGVVIDRDPLDGAIEAFPIQGDFPFPLVRTTS